MLYLIYGNNFKKARSKLNSMVEGLKKRRPESAIFKITEEDFLNEEMDSSLKLGELISSQGLFGGSYVVVCENIWAIAKDELKEMFPEIQQSEHIFIFLESALLKSDIREFEKAGAKMELFEDKRESLKETFNVFSLADALGSKDRKRLWLLYIEALRSGASVEQIHGMLFWQIKTISVVKKSQNENKLGIKPFVLNKARRFKENWTEEELALFSRGLLDTYHDVRRGEGNLETSLERLLLSI